MPTAYELLMASMAQNQATLGRGGINKPTALAQYGTDMLRSLGLGDEAIAELDPGSWASRLGGAIGLPPAGVADLEQNIGTLRLPDVGSGLVGLKDLSAKLQGDLNTTLTPSMTDLMSRSEAANKVLNANPTAQALSGMSPFQPLPEGTGILDAMNMGTPWESMVLENKGPQEPLPPSLEAIIREANQGAAPTQGMDTSRSFDLGALPPEELFRLSLGGGGSGVNMGSYAKLADLLPGAKRVQREIAPGQDFSSADAAMESAKPTYEEGGKWGQVLQGLARGALGGMDGDFSQLLFSAAMGALGGYGSGMDVEQERKDLAQEREREWNYNKANYEITKGGEKRSQAQQGFDATYEADVDFNSQIANRQQNVVSLLTQGLDNQAEDNRSSRSLAAQIAMRNQELALKRWEMAQPSVDVNQLGLVITQTDPKTGQRTMTLDNSPWVQKLQTQAMFRQMGALGMMPESGLPGMDFGDNAEVTPEDMLKKLSTYYFMNPMAATEDLGQEFLGQASVQSKNLAGENEKLFPQMMGNNIYSFLAPVLSNPNHPLHTVILKRMAQMQGMF